MVLHNKTPAMRIFWILFPGMTTLACVLLSMVPFGLSTTVLAPPSFGLIAIFLWTMIRPELLPAAAVFALGLLQDLLWGGPMGLWAFVFLLAYVLTLSQRTFLIGRGFGFTWAGFGLVAAIAGLVSWIFAMAFHGQFLLPYPAIVQTVLSAAVYPLFAQLSPWVMRQMVDNSREI
jgi:rod shape-determining protein MreD